VSNFGSRSPAHPTGMAVRSGSRSNGVKHCLLIFLADLTCEPGPLGALRRLRPEPPRSLGPPRHRSVPAPAQPPRPAPNPVSDLIQIPPPRTVFP
jgi:hypothetical protein